MKRLLKADFYRLFHDAAFKIALIIAAGIAVFLNLVFFLVSFLLNSASDAHLAFPSGSFNYFFSFLPAIMGMLISLIIAIYVGTQFSQGLIRSKVIIGYKRSQIYFSLYIVSLCFDFMLLLSYLALMVGLGSLLGQNFDSVMGSPLSYEYFFKLGLTGLATYLGLGTFGFFLGASLPNIGGAIPLLVITIDLLFTGGSLVSSFLYPNNSVIDIFNVFIWVDPLCSTSPSFTYNSLYGDPTYKPYIDNMLLAGGLMSLLYTALFASGGYLLFQKKDLK